MKKTFCDKCGTEIQQKRAVIVSVAIVRPDGKADEVKVDGRVLNEVGDLCETCICKTFAGELSHKQLAELALAATGTASAKLAVTPPSAGWMTMVDQPRAGGVGDGAKRNDTDDALVSAMQGMSKQVPRVVTDKMLEAGRRPAVSTPWGLPMDNFLRDLWRAMYDAAP